MARHRVWIEIFVLVTAIALGLALLLASLGAAAGAASAPVEGARVPLPQSAAPAQSMAPSQSFEGMVTCSRCGAKHEANLDRSATTCVRVCVHAGSNFALIYDDSTFLLDGDLNSFKKLAGQRVHVVGVRSGNTIKVASITAVI
jgi:hypothetical protein